MESSESYFILTRVFARGTTKSENVSARLDVPDVWKMFKVDQSLMLIKFTERISDVWLGREDLEYYVTREDYYKSLADEAAAQYVEGLNS